MYDHRELLETLSTMKGLTSKQMLSVLSAAEKEFYESSHNMPQVPPPEPSQSNRIISEELAKKLEEETRKREEAEKAYQELQKSVPEKSEIEKIKEMNKNLQEENSGLNKMLSEQGKYLKNVENLQQELMNSQAQKQSVLKSKEKLEENFEKNKRMIDDLKQEINLLQQEKDNLTRKLASTLGSQPNSGAIGRRIATSTKFNSPLKQLEESKIGKVNASTGQKIHALKRSRSFDSSLKYNRDLAALLMNSKEFEGGDLQVQPIEISSGSFMKNQQQDSHQMQADNPISISSIQKQDLQSPAPKNIITDESSHMQKPQTEGRSKIMDQTVEKERLHNIIKDLQNENQNLTCKLQEMEKKFQQNMASGGKQSIFASDISRIAPTFAGASPTQDRIFMDQQTPAKMYFSSAQKEPQSAIGHSVFLGKDPKESGMKYADILNMLEDVGDTLKIRFDRITYDKEKEPLDNIREYVKTLKAQIAEKEQTREMETALMEGRKFREKSRQWRDEIERLEAEISALREENDSLKRHKQLTETSKIHQELANSQAQYAQKLRDENLELMGKYEKTLNENYELRLKLRNAMVSPEKIGFATVSPSLIYAEKSPIGITQTQGNPLVGQLADVKIKLEEQLLKEKEKSNKYAEALVGYKERNELLKEELSLQREKIRNLEKEMLRYVKKTTNLSQEATVNKHNYKSIAANHAALANTLKKLQKENRTLKEQAKVNQTHI